MAAMSELAQELENLPPDYIQEVKNFINYLKHKKTMSLSETLLLSEKSLAIDWNTPEEDEAWANL